MSVRIRLARAGAKKKPFYRVVVADQRAPRDGRFIEIVGRYNPRTDPSLVELDVDRINDWISKGAQPTETVTKLMGIVGSPDAAAPETLKDKRVSKKQQAKASAEADTDAVEAEAPTEPEAAAEADESDDAAEATEASDKAEAPAVEETSDEAPADDGAAEEPAADSDEADGDAEDAGDAEDSSEE